MKYIQQGNARQKKQVTPKIIGELQQNGKEIRVQAFRICGKTTLLLIGTQTAFVRERKNCCKYVDSVFLPLVGRKAELYGKTTVALTKPFQGLVAQRTTRLTTNQIAGSNPDKLGDRLFTPMFLVFGETEQDYPIDRHQKNFAATKRKNDQ